MDAATLAEINSLESALGASLPHPPGLDARRHALLARHIGFVPRRPLPVLHVVGDSHSIFFGGTENIRFRKGRRIWTGFFRARYVSSTAELLPVFKVFHVGPATAWQADERGSSTCAREKIDALLRSRDIPATSRILLVFGEIDCRCHIPKAVLAGRSVETAVNETVDRFMRLPLRLKAAGHTPSVWLPSLTPVLEGTENPEDIQALPVIGPQALRDEITRAYCARLSDACNLAGIRSTGVTAPVDGPTSACFIDGHHLSQHMMPAALAALIEAGILPLASTAKPSPL